MPKLLVRLLNLLVGALLLITVAACVLGVVAVRGIFAGWDHQRTQASQVLENELASIDSHFNASLSVSSPSLSIDAIFPTNVNKFMRQTVQSGDTNSPCDESSRFEQSTYKTQEEAIVVLTIYYCLGKPMTLTPTMIASTGVCGDAGNILLLRETTHIPYLYDTCPNMFSGAERFAGMITWENGGSVFRLNGRTSDDITQFLQDYPY